MVAAAIETRPILEECRGATRLRGTPVRPTWWEQDLTLPPESEDDEDDDEPGTGGAGPPREGRSSMPARPRRQPDQRALAAQRAARRAEWEARDLAEEEEQDRRWAQAHLPSDLI